MSLLKVIIGLLAFYIAGFALFVATLPKQPPIAPKADAIVELTGGDARLKAAASLLERGAGRRLLITGVNKASTKDDLQHRANGGRRFACCTDIGYAAEDTYGNALETAAWTAQHRYKSLIVVTASYHMPRSLRLFRSLMPGVALLPYPVEPEGVDLSAWWRPGTLHLLHNEYLKYMASFVMPAVDRHEDDAKPAPTS